MMEKTRGLIIKQSDYGDGNRMLTVFTEDFGIVKAAVYGVKKAKSRQSAASQFLTWAEFILYFGKGEIASVNSVSPIESFFPICEDLVKLSLCTYLCELTLSLQAPTVPNKKLLRLMLNSFFACAYTDTPIKKIKSVYELRLANDVGYMPVLLECAACLKKKTPAFFSAEKNGFICAQCHEAVSGDIAVTENVYKAVGYILMSEEKKIFSFSINDNDLETVCRISERYICKYTEKSFSSLEYLKKLLT